MINSVTVRYTDGNEAKVVANLGKEFVENAVSTPPKDLNVTRKAYMQMPIRKKIFMHLKSYVQDMNGYNLNYDIN